MKQEIILKREELYHQVWSNPLIKLAKSYNLSDNGLRKICVKMDIPLPPAGYWMKLQFDKKVEKTPLPAPKSVTRLEYIIDPTIEKNRIVKPRNLPEIKVVENLKNLHPILNEALRYLNGDKSLSWWDTLTLNVSENSRKRSLRILDTIFKELEKRGYIVKLYHKMRVRTPMIIQGKHDLRFDLHEISVMNKNKNDGPSYSYKERYLFTGKLELRIEYFWGEPIRKTFKDGPKYKIEDLIPEFIENLLLGFQRMKEYFDKQEIIRLEQEELKRLAEIEIHKKEDEQRKVEFLGKMASQLSVYQSVKTLILQVRSKFESEIPTNDKLKEWIAWADQSNENMDPIKSLKFLDKFESR